MIVFVARRLVYMVVTPLGISIVAFVIIQLPLVHASCHRPRSPVIYGAKWPKAVAKITDDLDVLLAFYDYPAEYWIHRGTTKPDRVDLATVRLRQRVTKGPGSRAAGIAMGVQTHRVRPTALAR